jgi:hypothetical protein
MCTEVSEEYAASIFKVKDEIQILTVVIRLRIQFDHTHRLQGWWMERCWGIQPVLGQCQLSTKGMGSPKAGHENVSSTPLWK